MGRGIGPEVGFGPKNAFRMAVITLRRDAERQHDHERNREIWRTFRLVDRDDPLAGTHPFVNGFGLLESVTEDRIAARTTVSKHSQRSAEVMTYVQEGTLDYKDSLGRSGIIQAGQFQHTVVGNGVQQTQSNASPTSSARVFRIALRLAKADQAPGLEQRRFSTAERRGTMCIVASPDARGGSLRTRQDALVYSAMLAPGHHLVHELSGSHSAWLHVVRGVVALGDVDLVTGDGAGLTHEHVLSLTAREESEVLVIELGGRAAGSAE